MAEKIRVHIKGKEYILKGEDELLVRHAAEEVDNEIQTLEGSHLNQPPETVAILAALNIAEKRSIIEKQKMIDENYLVNELDRMAKYLDDAIAKGQPG